MELKEITQEVDALEPRLERLRSLYEQYFMGLEKIEPATVRREVDRKFWQLRKVRIQNTAIRFRLQMLIQRYNTYQQYWARVMREMERGTYRRDVLRAAKRVGGAEAMTILGKRRAKMFKKLADAQEERKGRAATLAEQQEEALAEAVDQVEAGASIDEAAAWTGGGGDGADDYDDDAPTRPPPAPTRPTPIQSPASLVDPSAWDLFAEDRSAAPNAGAARPAASDLDAGLPGNDPTEEPATTEWLRDLKPPKPIKPRRPRPQAAVLEDDDAPTMPPPAGGAARARGAQLTGSALGARPAPPTATASASPAGGSDREAPPAAEEPPTAPRPPPVRNRPLPRPAPTPVPREGPPPGPSAGRSRAIPPPPPAADPPPSPAPPPRPNQRRPLPAPARKPPVKPPGPDAPKRPPAPAERKLYERYVKAKKAANESTAGLTYEKMERSLKKQTERLRQKHGDRKIDYEVITKDGRTLIRPKIK